MKSKKIH